MCIFIIKHWIHPDSTLHRWCKLVERCNLNVATPGTLPDDCADRRCIYLKTSERGRCPMCAQQIQQSTTDVPLGNVNERQAHAELSAPVPEPFGSSNSNNTTLRPIDMEGDTDSLLSPRGRHASSSNSAPLRTTSRVSITSSWPSRQSSLSSLSICFPGRHDLEDCGDAGFRCRICNVISGQRSSIQSSAGMYGTPEAFADDDDGTSTVVSADDGQFEFEIWQELTRSRSQSVVPAETDHTPGDATPLPASPAESMLSTATSAQWREFDKAMMEHSVSRDF